jgi:hypothetical protein
LIILDDQGFLPNVVENGENFSIPDRSAARAAACGFGSGGVVDCFLRELAVPVDAEDPIGNSLLSQLVREIKRFTVTKFFPTKVVKTNKQDGESIIKKSIKMAQTNKMAKI